MPGGVPSWDLTNLVRGWVNGSLPNNGVALRSASEATTWTVSFPSREGGPGGLVLQVTFAFDPNPRIVGTVPDQVKPEDSPPWTLDLAGFALDADTPLTRLRWNLVGVNATLYQVLGGNVTGGQVLTFRALPNQFGNNLVTLFLFDDQSHFAKQPLWVNLTPVNDPPLFDPPGVLYVRYDTPYAFNFTEDMSDVDNDVGSLVLSTDDPVHAPVTPPPHWVTFLYPQSFANRWAYVTLTVSDGQASVSRVVAVWVSSNYPPELTRLLPDVTLFEHQTLAAVFDLDDYFIDRDQNSVFYTWGYSHVTVTIQANNSVDIAALANWWGQELVTFEAVDPLGAFVEDTIVVTVIPVNDPPVLAPLPPLVVHYDYNYSFDLTPYLSDPDTPIVDLSVGTSNPNNVTVQGRVLTLLFPQRLGALTAPYLVPLTVTVSDGLNSVFQSTSVSVTDDFPPTLNRTLPDVTFAEDTRAVYPRTFDLDDYFVDSDSPPPVYSYYGNENVSVTLHANHTVDFSAPVNWSGGEFVTFRATDNRSAFAADTVYVLVTPVNDAPYIYPVPAQVRDGPGSWLLDLAPYIVDSDTNVTLLTVSTGAHPRVTALGLVLLFDYSDGPRTETVTVTVSDGELTATRTIEVEVLGPNPVLPLVPWLLAAAFLTTLFLWNRYLRAIVEEVFVIHRDGLLIAHLSRTLTPDKDRDTVSAMFTVVQEFVRDTFRDTGETSQIDAMNIGHRKVSIRQGRSFYLAVLYRGFGASRVEAKAEAVVKQVEARFGTELEHWSGVTRDVQGIVPLLERMFRVRGANVAPDDKA